MLQKMFHAGKYMIKQYYWKCFGTIWGLHIRSTYSFVALLWTSFLFSPRPKVAIERMATVYTMYGNGDLSRRKLCISHAMKIYFKKNTCPIVLSVVSRKQSALWKRKNWSSFHQIHVRTDQNPGAAGARRIIQRK
jgi:hypothetical protein